MFTGYDVGCTYGLQMKNRSKLHFDEKSQEISYGKNDYVQETGELKLCVFMVLRCLFQ